MGRLADVLGDDGLSSIVLAFMNILPIPALDGGHVVFLLYEMVARRPASQKVLEVAQMVGMFLLLALILLANGNDVLKWFSGRLCNGNPEGAPHVGSATMARVILIEDDPLVRTLLMRRLTAAGWGVIALRDGRDLDAIVEAQKSTFWCGSGSALHGWPGDHRAPACSGHRYARARDHRARAAAFARHRAQFRSERPAPETLRPGERSSAGCSVCSRPERAARLGRSLFHHERQRRIFVACHASPSSVGFGRRGPL
jgi:hypothetical protein